MGSRVLLRLFAPIRGLHEAAFVLGILTLLSQVLALLRDRTFAHTFGAGTTLDLYYAAFKIPDLVFALIASLVSAYVLVPRLGRGSTSENQRLLSVSVSFLLIAGGLVSALLALCTPLYIFRIFPEFLGTPAAGTLVLLVRLLLLQPILLGLSAILSSVTQLEKRFTLFALSPVLYNAGIIFGAVMLYPHLGVEGVALGVLVGAALHLALHVPVVVSAGLVPRLTMPRAGEVFALVRSSVPRSLALGMGSLTALGLAAIANRIGAGALSLFTLGGNLEAVPLSLIGVAYASAAFPSMAASYGEGDTEGYASTFAQSLRHLVFWSVLATLFALVFRDYVVRIILGTGRFSLEAGHVTAAVFGILSIALVAQGIILLCARAFYAAGRSWNPLWVQLADCGLSVASAGVLVHEAALAPEGAARVLAYVGVGSAPAGTVVFVALGFLAGQLVMAAAALLTVRALTGPALRSVTRPLRDSLLAGLVGASASAAVLSWLPSLSGSTTFLAACAAAALAGMVGIVTAGLTLGGLRNQEFREFSGALRRRLPGATR